VIDKFGYTFHKHNNICGNANSLLAVNGFDQDQRKKQEAKL